MAEIRLASYAFAGSGVVDDGNASALLDDFLPDALGAVYRPTRVPRSNQPLARVINWLESPDVLDTNGTVASDDLVASLLSRREEGDECTLVVIWPEEPSEDELALVKAAFEAGIPVKNLAAALDDLDKDVVFPPEPEPEAPAEEAAAPAPTGDIQEDLVQAAVGAIDSVAEQLAQGIVQNLELFVRRIVRSELAKAAAAAAPEAPAKEKPARAKPASRSSSRSRGPRTAAADELEDSASPPSTAAKFQDGGQPGDDGQERIAYYMNEDGDYRKAKTRPRRGEQRVELTLDEIDDLVKRGKIKDS